MGRAGSLAEAQRHSPIDRGSACDTLRVMQRLIRHPLVFALAASAVLVACAGEALVDAAVDAGDVRAAERALAEPIVRLTAVDGTRARLDAVWARREGLRRADLVDALGYGELPAAVEGCRVARSSGLAEGDAELVDAGSLRVDSGGGEITIAPLVIPGYVDGLRGVIYGDEVRVGADGLSVHVEGGGALPPHRVDLPPLPSLGVSVDVTADAVRVAWQTDAREVVVEVRDAGRHEDRHLLCRFDEAGGVRLHGSALRDVFPLTDGLAISVHAVQRVAVNVDGLAGGEAIVQRLSRHRVELTP